MEKKSNALSIVSLVFGIIGLVTCCLGISVIFNIVAIVCGIVALVKKQSKGMAITGITTGGIGLILAISLIAMGGLSALEEYRNGSTEQTTTTETTAETTTAEYEYTEEPELTKEEFVEQAVEVAYEDLFRNPETYRGKPVKFIAEIEEYDPQLWGLFEYYYATLEDKDIYLEDTRTLQEPTITKGDTVLIYGYGSGLATLTEEQKNFLGITKDSEKSQIPSVDIKYCELQ